MNEAPSVGLSASLNAAGFQLGRLQTGTPARLAKDSIDYSKFEIQEGDKDPLPFSFMNDRVANAVSLNTSFVLAVLTVLSGQSSCLLENPDDVRDASDSPG